MLINVLRKYDEYTVKFSSMTGLICSLSAIFNLFIGVNHKKRETITEKSALGTIVIGKNGEIKISREKYDENKWRN